MVFGIFWLGLAIAVGIFASNKGRSGFGWFLLSVIISPLLGLIFCVVSKDLSKKAGPEAPSTATHRKCPACAELILPEATVCKHCTTKVAPDTGFAARRMKSIQDAETAESQTLLIVGGLIGGTVILVYLLSKCSA